MIDKKVIMITITIMIRNREALKLAPFHTDPHSRVGKSGSSASGRRVFGAQHPFRTACTTPTGDAWFLYERAGCLGDGE